MAIVDRNIILHNIQGQLGKTMVFRTLHGKTVASRYPDMSNVKRSPNQKAYSKLFSMAVENAVTILADPVLKEALLKRMKQTKKLKNRNPFNVLVSEYMKEQSNILSKEGAAELLTLYREKYKLSDRQGEALKFMFIFGELTTSLYIEVTKTAPSTAKRDLADLVKQGILTATLNGRATKYKLLDKLG